VGRRPRRERLPHHEHRLVQRVRVRSGRRQKVRPGRRPGRFQTGARRLAGLGPHGNSRQRFQLILDILMFCLPHTNFNLYSNIFPLMQGGWFDFGALSR
jgi:hypothetical protein